jgi:hypothetical protein
MAFPTGAMSCSDLDRLRGLRSSRGSTSRPVRTTSRITSERSGSEAHCTTAIAGNSGRVIGFLRDAATNLEGLYAAQPNRGAQTTAYQGVSAAQDGHKRTCEDAFQETSSDVRHMRGSEASEVSKHRAVVPRGGLLWDLLTGIGLAQIHDHFLTRVDSHSPSRWFRPCRGRPWRRLRQRRFRRTPSGALQPPSSAAGPGPRRYPVVLLPPLAFEQARRR